MQKGSCNISLLLSLTKLRTFFRVIVEVSSPAVQFFIMRPTFLPWDTRVTLLSSRARGDAEAWDTFVFCKERLLKWEFLSHKGMHFKCGQVCPGRLPAGSRYHAGPVSVAPGTCMPSHAPLPTLSALPSVASSGDWRA